MAAGRPEPMMVVPRKREVPKKARSCVVTEVARCASSQAPTGSTNSVAVSVCRVAPLSRASITT